MNDAVMRKSRFMARRINCKRLVLRLEKLSWSQFLKGLKQYAKWFEMCLFFSTSSCAILFPHKAPAFLVFWESLQAFALILFSLLFLCQCYILIYLTPFQRSFPPTLTKPGLPTQLLPSLLSFISVLCCVVLRIFIPYLLTVLCLICLYQ